MAKNTVLSNQELEDIAHNEEQTTDVLTQILKARQFKLNDILVCSENSEGTWRHLINSYGTRIKYKVVHVDACGIPYIKEISSKGALRGQLKTFVSFGYCNIEQMYYEDYMFEHDPGFVESIILSAEDTYNPTENQSRKKQIRDEITRYNAESKIKSEIPELVAAFNTMAPGQTWWFSPKNSMTIISVRTLMPVPTALRKSYKKHQPIMEIDVVLPNGKSQTYQPHDFLCRNLYTKQPRTYKELSDSI